MKKDTNQSQHYVAVDPRLLSNMEDDDEINLIELWLILVKRWKIIVGTALLVVLVAVAYTVIAPKEYKTDVLVFAPEKNDVQELDIEIPEYPQPSQSEKEPYLYHHKLVSLDAKTAFKSVQTALTSQRMQRAFLATSNNESLFSAFSSKSSTQVAINNESITFSLSWHDPEMAAQLANNYVNYVDDQITSQIIERSKQALKEEIAQLDKVLMGNRLQEKNALLDQIVSLEEALRIATNLGIKDISRNGDLLALPYLRGYLALAEEVKSLKNKSPNDTYRADLQYLQSARNYLSELTIDASKVKVMLIEQPAIVPSNPIKPKQKLIISVSVVLGIMLGIFMAFFLNFVASARTELKRKAETS